MIRTLGLVLIAVPATLQSQAVVPRAYLARDLVIDAKQIKAEGSGAVDFVTVGGDGRMIIMPRSLYGGMHGFDAKGQSLGWKLPLGGPDSEIGSVQRTGWMGDVLWIADQRFGQLVLVSPSGKVVRTIEFPSWVHPRWAERRKYPLFAAMEPLALYPDSSMLVMPMRPRPVLDTPGFDRSRMTLLRINTGGAILRTVATYDIKEGRTIALKDEKGAEFSVAVPFAARRWHVVSPDGQRIALVTPGLTEADSGTFRVTMLDDKGDTVYQRRYPQPAVRVSKFAVDSALARTVASHGMPATQIRPVIARSIPAFRSFLTDVFVGLDRSAWVVLHPTADSARTRDALVLDEHGTPVATVQIPAGLAPLVVDREHLWAVDRAKYALLRFTLQATPPAVAPIPAPPARTVKASAAKSPARQ